MAKARFGGTNWIDLSTGINRVAYPIPDVSQEAWTALPNRSALARLEQAARGAYGCSAPLLALAGAQAAIQLVPRLAAAGRARILAPTYNEHSAALRAAGWDVKDVVSLAELAGADLAVVVNPNNPDGQLHDRAALLALSQLVGRLVVDESFADVCPEFSVGPDAEMGRILVQRSFGKFYGLAGVRLGFVIGGACDIAALTEMAGPWAISGAAIEIGIAALSDSKWRDATLRRLRYEAMQLDALACSVGWTVVGGTPLFRLYETPHAIEAQEQLARHQIWSRTFPYSRTWVRLGLPGGTHEWARIKTAFQDLNTRALL